MEAAKKGSLWEITYKGLLFARLTKKPTVAELATGKRHIDARDTRWAKQQKDRDAAIKANQGKGKK